MGLRFVNTPERLFLTDDRGRMVSTTVYLHP